MSAMDYAASTQAPRSRTALAAMSLAALVFGWRSEHRKARLAARRERELELEIARLRAVGGF
ncbi:hypothetical protein [Caulobacter sp. NIBR1757]|uniref:hypothetical protein n=1 Tax=Caulobacter sp. NIBR1757 TaxID=3016000 RepID=UPI0022F13D12|nr:hypothetical protein [Caulobacter sp. NIBR1757]WGM37262.1 hypothetical protein AMEJIAPC_00156 [Caulobacter sp. NIBR1757]